MRKLLYFATLGLATSAVTPAWASTFSVGGGTITTAQTDDSIDQTGTGGAFILKPNTAGDGDVITISGLTLHNTTGGGGSITNPGQAINLGYQQPLLSTGSYSIVMNGSTLTNWSGAGTGAFLAAGNSVSFNSTGGASNVISGDYRGLQIITSNGNALIKTGADTITSTNTLSSDSGALVAGVGSGTGTVSIDSVGASITAAKGNGIYAGTITGDITIGGLNGGIASTIASANGVGIYVASGNNIGAGNAYITLASAGTITAPTGIEVHANGLVLDSWGTIAAANFAIKASDIRTNDIITLESSSVTQGLVLGSPGNDTVSIFTGATITAARFDLGGGFDTIFLRGAGNGAIDLSTVGNADTLTKRDGGTWTITGPDARAGGDTFINAGVLKAGAVNVLSAYSAFSISSGAFLDLAGFNQAIGSLAGNGMVTNSGGPATLTVGADNTSTTFSGIIQDGGGALHLTKTGTGTLYLNGAANTYSGGTLISGGLGRGTLGISGSGVLGTGAIVINDGTLRAVASASLANSVEIDSIAGTISAASGQTLTLTGNLALNTSASNGSTVYIGSTTDTGTVNVSSSTVTLGANPGPLEIIGGTLKDTSTTTPQSNFATALGNLSSVTIDSGATLEIDSNGNGRTSSTESYIKLFGAGQLVVGGSYLPRVVLGNSNFSGQITAAGTGYIGIGPLDSTKPHAIVVLTGNNNSAVEFQIGTGSTLQIGSGGTTGSLSNSAHVVGYSGSPSSGNAILEYDRSDNVTLGSFLIGSLVLQQAGSGVLTVSANNKNGTSSSFYGSVVVSSGGLSISSDNNLNGNPVALSDGTTLYTTASGPYTSPVSVSGNATFNVMNGTIATWSGQIANGSSPGGIRVTGGGTLSLTNASNSFSGGMVVSVGTVAIANNSALGAPSGVVALNGGTLEFASGLTMPASRSYTIGSAGGTFNVDASSTIAGVIGGPGHVTYTGFGGLTLTGNNTYTGGTTIYEGAILVGNGGTTGSIVGDVVSGVATSNAGINFNRSDNITFSGNISGLGYVAQYGPGILTLTGTNTYSGGTVLVGNGALAFSSDSNIGTGPIKIGYAATVQFNASFVSTASYELGAGQINTNGNNVTLSGAVFTDPGVNVSFGYGGLTKIGPGTLILAGSDTYQGPTLISAGTLQIGNGGTSGSTGTGTSITDNGSLIYNRSDTVAVGSTISGTGALTQAGVGTVVLTANNTYSGGTTISQGTLQIGNGGTTGSISGNIVNNGTLAFERADITYSSVISGTGNLVQLQNNTLTLTGNNTFTGTTTISAGAVQLGNGGTSGSLAGDIVDNHEVDIRRSDNETVANRISGNGVVLILGSGITTLAGSNSYTGGTVIATPAGGALSISADTNLGNTSDPNNYLRISGGSILEITAGGAFRDPVYVDGSDITGGASIIKVMPNVTVVWSAPIVDEVNFSVPTLVQIAGGGTFAPTSVSAATNPFNGHGMIDGGYVVVGGSRLLIDNDLELGTSAAMVALGDAGSSGTLQFGSSITVNHAVNVEGGAILDTNGFTDVIAGVISGSGSLTKVGNGTATVSATNTFTGPTTVATGTLNVTGSLVQSSVSVVSGAGLSGTGKTGSVNVASGGTLGAGAGSALGTLTVQGNLVLAAGATTTEYITPAGSSAAAVTGTAGVNGTLIANAASGTYAVGQHYTLVTAAGGLSGTYSSLTTTGLPGYVKGRLSYDANDVYLYLDANALSPLLGANVSGDEKNVAGGIDAAIKGGASLSGGFLTLTSLSGNALDAAMDQLSDQIANGAFEAANQSFTPFLALLTQMGGQSGNGPAVNFAPQASYDIPGAPHPAQATRELRFWGSVFGGHSDLSGDASSGAHDLSSGLVGLAAGIETQLDDVTLLGLSLAGGHESFSSGDGHGGSDDFMLAAYGHHAIFGSGYVSAALAYGWNDVTTRRVVTVSGSDVLTANFASHDLGGRIEAGYGLVLDDGSTLFPYSAYAGQEYHAPGYSEKATSGSSTFALSYAPRTTDAGHIEIGSHYERSFATAGGAVIALDATGAWEHEINDNPLAQAAFQALPGSSFVVYGTRPAPDTALLGLGMHMNRDDDLSFGFHGDARVGTGTTILTGTADISLHW